MAIRSVDVAESARIKKLDQRKYKNKERNNKNLINIDQASNNNLPLTSSSSNIISDANVTTNSTLETAGTSGSSSNKQICRNMLQLPTLARVCDQFGISNRSAAAIASAVLQNVGIITREDSPNIIDKNKVRRAR
ncbi:hypothetical protein RN001_013903 [Aquatica leii]|uniref:Uncharacterized protein n=1 Tax=Aquatica leii TaxID=1421715 RepID=A0AAN7SLT2_9COLE|nr:hypothetical protein RN001_013903 [Aquatica leii]